MLRSILYIIQNIVETILYSCNMLVSKKQNKIKPNIEVLPDTDTGHYVEKYDN